MTTRGRCIKVVLLSREELTFFVEGKSKVQEVLSQVCEHLTLRENEYFGLAKFTDGEYEFLDATTKFHKLLHKQPRQWRAHKQEERVSLTLYFRVQYYVEHISLLKERVTRQLYYQQLKDNLLHYAQEVSEEQCFQLAAYSLQADLGNYQHDTHANNYFDPREYFPAWIVEKRGLDYIKKNMPLMHSECRSMSRPEACKLYIRDLSRPPLAHNMHMYRVKKQKQEEPGSVWVAVSPSGIYIYQDEAAYRTLLSVFEWKNIGRLHFEKKKFEIQPSGSDTRKFRYYTGSDDRGKHLLGLCKRSHQFQLSMAPKLAEQQHMEAEDRRYRETYIYSDIVQEQGLTAMGRKFSFSRSPGRFSNASSATTSGIASERLHTSLDEDTHEILIDSPPQVVGRIPPHLSGDSGGMAAGSVLTTPTSHGHSPLTVAPVSSRTGSGRIPGLITAAVAPAPLTSTSSRQGSGRSPVGTLLGSSSISRTSSAHSHRGIPPLTCPTQPNLVPADAHLQKMSFPKKMTVTSNPVGARLGAGDLTATTSNQIGGQMAPQRTSAYPVVGLPPQQQQQQPQPQQHQVNSVLLPQYQPQFAQSVIPASPKDHTYANFESIQSQPIYTQTSLPQTRGAVSGYAVGETQQYQDNTQPHSHYQQSTHASYQDLAAASYEVRSNHLVYQDNNAPQLEYQHDLERAYRDLQMSYPDVDMAYMQENMVPGSRPPPVSRAREFIVNRPNRSYSQVTPPNKVLSPPQRAQSNADAYLAKRPNRVDCPVHGIRTDLFQEIQAKSSGKNLPLLAALCRDKSLQQQQKEECCCHQTAADSTLKRLSYSHPSSSSTPDLYQPGSVARPVSWHEPTNLDHAQLQVFRGSINIDEQKPNNGGGGDVVNSIGGPLSPPYTTLTTTTTTQGMLLLPYNGVLHQSMESLDYPTMVTYNNNSPLDYRLPSRLHSGGGGGGLSGAQSVDNLLGHNHHNHHHHNNHHHFGLGIAT